MLEHHQRRIGLRLRDLAVARIEIIVAVEPPGDEIVNLVDREDDDRRGHSRSMPGIAR